MLSSPKQGPSQSKSWLPVSLIGVARRQWKLAVWLRHPEPNPSPSPGMETGDSRHQISIEGRYSVLSGAAEGL
jgi:hypothetical protein